jgi:hypothetical protein
MSHITTQYETVSIDPSGSVSVRVSKVFVDDNEVEVATAREKQYFQRDATITDLPAHYQSAINAFWSGLPSVEEPVVEEEVPAEESGDDTEE